ncbi:MAG TPA: hypothetical protein VIF12_04450 [Micavibrio sp.]|jgi:hypothetical protein
MLEAINSVISNASLVRAQAEQTSSARSLTANPESVQVVPQAPYISPYIKIDVNYDTAVLAMRDRDTGDFLTTIPSDSRLEARARDAARDAAQALTRPAPETPQPEPQQAQAAPQPSPQAQPQPQGSSDSFGAFVRQVASLQTAIAGGSTGGTVSLSA